MMWGILHFKIYQSRLFLMTFQYFKMFVDYILIDLPAEKSNIHSLQLTGSSISVTLKEIEQFNGTHFCMGLVIMPSIRSYWGIYLTYDGVSSLLSRNRFLSILRNIHFVDNFGVTDETKNNYHCWKIRPWLEKLHENYLVA